VADVRGSEGKLRLHDVRRVQQLGSSGPPFDGLAALLSTGAYLAAGIDAPFSVPERFVTRIGGHAALLKLVGTQAVVNRPFIKGSDFVRVVAGAAPPLTPPKPMRETDTWWTKRGVNVRSSMWTGTRPGAPMTAACLTLLHRAGRPMWPWSNAGPGLLVEAFPAGQLCAWDLPHQRYDGPAQAAVATRTEIVGRLSARLQLGSYDPTLLAFADALDAVLCAFAAIAISKAPAPPFATAPNEGCIYVHP
jgi:hypothetical protein